ncbi:MAG: two-component system, chemotaxis family, sensor kinase CheA [Acidobacteriaceae bacterium]|nr:two-component system, chemotaxis family, sensor kinase CheA [Acidobacteriaceae bacterium]
MTNPPDERGAELRELFFETAQELMQALNEESLKLEKHPGDEEIVRSIRRTVHTLKGDSAACGLRELSELAHQFEDALSLESAVAHGALAEISFAATDVFGEMLSSYHHGGPLPSTESLRHRINELTSAPAAKRSRRKKQSPEPAPQSSKTWTDAEKHAIAQAKTSGLGLYSIVVKIDPHCAMPIAARQLIQNSVREIGRVLVLRPDTKSPAASKQVEFVLASTQSKEQIAAKCHIPTIVGDISVTLIHAASLTATPAAPPTPASGHAVPILATPAEAQLPTPEAGMAQGATENILRVEAGRIDNVLNLVGELIIGKSMLQQALNEFGKRYPRDLLRGKFSDAMAFQARVLNDLQRSVMKIRMVPVEQLFRRFPRLVRDVARQCGHEVDLELSGLETDLDKGILDAIAEPLTHLVRNAVSHGIESAEERRSQGKPPRGKIRLHAYHQGNQVVVEISDDGRGVDAQKIRRKAIELGMVSAEEAARMSDAEALDFMFRPGFSTAEEVTEVSGRGVGMDIVQSVLQRLKATIHVETHVGQGTTFRLKLPLTLAIIKALMFWVEQRLYAIPLNAVSQIARTRESEVHQVDNYEVLQLRNQVLPLLRLGRPSPTSVDPKTSKLFVLVITVGEKNYGLIVDALEGEEELVIKALGDQTFSTDLVNGASILGDGKVVLILNLPAVVEHVARTRPQDVGLPKSGLLLNHADRARLAPSATGGPA